MCVKCLTRSKWKLLGAAVIVIVVTINSGHALQSRKLTIRADVNLNNWHHIINTWLRAWTDMVVYPWSSEEMKEQGSMVVLRQGLAQPRQNSENQIQFGRKPEGWRRQEERRGWRGEPSSLCLQQSKECRDNIHSVTLYQTVVRLSGKGWVKNMEKRNEHWT